MLLSVAKEVNEKKESPALANISEFIAFFVMYPIHVSGYYGCAKVHMSVAS